MENSETILKNEQIDVQELNEIIVIFGKLKIYLVDLHDKKNLTVDQFLARIDDAQEFKINKGMQYFNDLNQARVEKTIGIKMQKFDYAASMRERECKILSEIVNNNLTDVYFRVINNIGYYLVYFN
jgi:hypothetical protein